MGGANSPLRGSVEKPSLQTVPNPNPHYRKHCTGFYNHIRSPAETSTDRIWAFLTVLYMVVARFSYPATVAV